MRLPLFGLPSATEIIASPQEYLAGKYPRFGTANPEMLHIPFWNAMIHARVAAYSARVQFNDTGYENPADSAVWCFQRFGSTLTRLPDGRYVEIGGEHEDFYDRDFCIYNDVVVYDGNGGFIVYGYPQELFPPTDFHSATLVGPFIYLIGRLGYQGMRSPGSTPVYRLNWTTWQIEQVATADAGPGWISRHTATYDSNANQIVVQGGKQIVAQAEAGELYGDTAAAYALDLATMHWRRI